MRPKQTRYISAGGAGFAGWNHWKVSSDASRKPEGEAGAGPTRRLISRRKFIAGSAGAVGGLMLAGSIGPFLSLRPRSAVADAIPRGSLDPTTVSKYVMPLVIPPAMPPTTVSTIDYYEIAVRQFLQQILPPGRPATTVWSYGSVANPGTFNYPAFTIEATVNRPVRVKWINELVDGNGHYLPHLLPVDPTLHWANPPGGTGGRDMHPTFNETPGPYTGPVPMVVHLHGGHNTEESDGYPEAWYLPAANNIPSGYATVGSYYEQFKAKAESINDAIWDPGSAVFQYANDQRAGTNWYHDHTLGMTRLNVYAGPAGFYLLRGGSDDLPSGVLPGPAPRLGDPPGTKYYEIPIVIQDRSFNVDGSLFYPDTRAFFDGFTGPYVGSETYPGSGVQSDISPILFPIPQRLQLALPDPEDSLQSFGPQTGPAGAPLLADRHRGRVPA